MADPLANEMTSKTTKVVHLFMKIRDAIRFITKPFGVPEVVVTEAAEAATRKILEHFEDGKAETID